MRIPILPAKLAIPPLPASYLPRPRLDGLWQEWEDKRLVLVTAGAGFGKTSYLAANARSSRRPCLWYSLDEMDRELVSFCAHLQRAAAGDGDDAANGEVGDTGAGTSESRADAGEYEVPEVTASDNVDFASRVLAGLVRSLQGGGQGRILILDDVQLVAGSDEILHFIERLVRFIPQGSTLILSSREPVAIATMKLQALGVVASLTAEDLQFTSEEVADLFKRQFEGAELEPSLCRRLVKQTEGWAAGIQIFMQVLGGVSSHHVEEALAKLSAAGASWFAYFAEEVVRLLDQQTRDFLYRSSVLPRLEADLCDRVLRRRDSRQVLEQLCHRNLFTFRVTTGDGSYRYHHLFRDFLRDQLRRTVGLREIQSLQRRAANALKRAGAWAEAAAAYAEAGDSAATLKLIEKTGEDLLATGQYEIIRRSLGSIPDRELKQSAGALFVLGRVTEIQGDWEEAEKIYQQALRRCRQGARRVELMSLIAQLKLRRGMYNACRTLCRKALDEPGRKSARVRGRILNMLGIAACELGKLDEGEKYLHEAIKVFRRGRDEVGESRTFYLLPGNIYYRRGEFQRAKKAARRALVVFKKRKDPRRICHSLGVLAFVTAEAAEEREARDLASEGLRLAESIEYRVMEAYCHFSLGKCALIAGELELAREHIETSRQLGEQLGEPGLLTLPLLGLADVALARGDLPEARRHAQDALDVALDLNNLYQEAQSCTILGIVAAADKLAEATKYWRRAEKIIRRVGMLFDLHRLLLIRLVAGEVKKGKQAAVLEELLAGTARLGHDFLFLILDRERAVQMLSLALRLGVEEDYAGRLLVRLGPHAVPRLAPLVKDPDEQVKGRAVEILAQIGGSEALAVLAEVAGTTGEAGRAAGEAVEELARTPGVPLRILALGSLTVSSGDRHLGFAQWKSTRALRLFQLLLVHRFRWVPRDVVLEELWPDTDPRKGVNNLRQTIHVLRKTLEPHLEEARNSRYVRYRNEAIRLEPGESYFYDVEEFEAALREAEVQWRAREWQAAEPHLRRAEKLYRGGFLEESPYEELTTVEREQLRDRLLRAVKNLLVLLTEEERWEELIPLCRRALAQNPYHEDFYWYLVRAQFELGNRREALADFHQYEEMMIREMELLPSARMKALADKVVTLGTN